jgi:hypothetical protein
VRLEILRVYLLESSRNTRVEKLPVWRQDSLASDLADPIVRVPTKAQQAVDRLLDKIGAKADQAPPAAKEETDRGEEKRDATGHFAKGTRPGPGRPLGSCNKVPKSLKKVVRDLGEGVIDVTFKDPATSTKSLKIRPCVRIRSGTITVGIMIAAQRDPGGSLTATKPL